MNGITGSCCATGERLSPARANRRGRARDRRLHDRRGRDLADGRERVGFGLGWSDGQESNAHHHPQLAVPAHIPLAPESGDVYQTQAEWLRVTLADLQPLR